MKTIKGSNHLQKHESYHVVTIGNFDGVHNGHQKIITKLLQISKKNSGQAILLTFTPHPVKILCPDLAPQLIQTDKQKELMLSELGIDTLIFETFTKKLSQMSARDFFEKILIGKLRIKEMIIGYDFTIGVHRSGTINEIKKLATTHKIKFHIIPPLFINDSLISSTHIRHFIKKGDIQKATAMLGRPYSITGKVIKGRGIGTKLGYHTANLTSTNELIPPIGVYITSVKIENINYKAVTNIGYNPTFGGTELSIETYILDFKKNILKQNIELFFLKKIRREMTFESHKKLQEQIEKDVKIARSFHESRI